MKKNNKADLFYLLVVIAVIAAVPMGISAYDRFVWDQKIPGHARVFHLTGHTVKGWVKGDIKAVQVLMDTVSPKKNDPPVFTVKKGDTVVIILSSSDVIHGFSLKDFGVFINDGIHPGRPVTVSFVADKTGTFKFACNAICGSLHENMTGTLVVTA